MILLTSLGKAVGDSILGMPIIGDIFYIFLSFMTGLIVFTMIVLPIEYFGRYFLKKNILFPNFHFTRMTIEFYRHISNSYNTNIWLCLIVAFNSLAIRYNIHDNEGIIYLCILWSIGLIPAFIAYSKGRNFYNWWMYGHLLFIVAVPHAISLKETEYFLIQKGVLRKCPYCAETVKKEATVCKHCGNALV